MNARNEGVIAFFITIFRCERKEEVGAALLIWTWIPYAAVEEPKNSITFSVKK